MIAYVKIVNILSKNTSHKYKKRLIFMKKNDAFPFNLLVIKFDKIE